MARARNIKPGLFKNEVLGVADPIYTLLFEGLWLLADREGRLEDRPLRIKAEVFPYRDGINMEAMLGWLVDAGFIQRYQVGGLALVQILNFAKHQNPHKNEPESSYPGPEVIGTTSENIGTTRADPGFLIPDSGLLIAPIPATAAAAPTPSPSKAKSRKTGMPDDFAVSERVKTWASEKGYDRLAEHLDAFRRKATAKGYTYVDWDSAFMEAIREDWAKLRGRGANGAAPPPESAGSGDPDSKSAIEAEGIAKGIGAWDEIKEQWHVYKARVRGIQPSLGLDQLAAMAARRAH